MESLIKRIELSDGPCIELDEAISDVVFSDAPCQLEAEPYTSSLDAAMKLIPDGFVFNMGNDGKAWAFLWQDTPDYDGYPIEGRAPTPAQALCAAALRARL